MILSKETISINLLTIKEAARKFNWSTSSLKRLIYAEDDINNFNRCVFRAGRKVWIEEHAFLDWLFEINNKPLVIEEK